MTHPPATAPAGQPQPGDPGPPGHSADRAVRIQVGPGRHLLGVLAAGFGALTLPAVAPGQPALAYLVPGAGLDGGRIVRVLAWARSGDPARAGLIAARAGQVAARAGQVAGAVLTAAGATAVLTGHLPGLWIVLLGLLMIGRPGTEGGTASAGPQPG